MKTAYLTGAKGFVGTALSERLVQMCQVEELDYRMLQQPVTFESGSVLIHCAARVHIMGDNMLDALSAYRQANRDLTLRLAESAAEQGVGRFVFISSIKVNGEATAPGVSFTATSEPAPIDAYAISKYEAEQGLLALAQRTSMEVVILRPPLIYGPGVKANFRVMMDWLARGIPLPLGAINNQRSLLALDNFVDLIMTVAEHPNAANQIFLAADEEPVSTPQLLRLLGRALGKPARLFPVPTGLLRLGARVLGKGLVADRLCESLQVDTTWTRERLNWRAPVSMESALQNTADAYWQVKQR